MKNYEDATVVVCSNGEFTNCLNVNELILTKYLQAFSQKRKRFSQKSMKMGLNFRSNQGEKQYLSHKH